MGGQKTSEILKSSKELILQRWESQVRTDLLGAKNESKKSLRDSIPDFLDYLIQALDNNLSEVSAEIRSFAHHHGFERANDSSYTIEEALAEYNILRKVIFQALEEKISISPTEREIIYDAINLGLTRAGTEFAKTQMQELAQTHSTLEAIIHGMPSAVWIATKDAKIYKRNKLSEGFLPLKGQKDWPLNLISEGSSLRNRFFEVETYMGDMVQIRLDSAPILDESGALLYTVIIGTDITELLKAQTSLKASENNFREFFLRSPIGMAEVGPTSKRILKANPKFVGMTLYDEAELLNLNFSDLLHPEDKVKLLSLVGSEKSLELRLMKKNGQLMWVEISASGLKSLEGQPACQLFACVDITDRKNVETNLLQYEERFNLATNATYIAFWEYDITKDRAWRSDSHDTLYGHTTRLPRWTMDDFAGHVIPQDRKAAVESLEKAFRGELEHWKSEYRVKWQDGSVHWISASGHLFRDERGNPEKLIGTLIDITDQKYAFESLHEEMILREKFISTLSHDLRTPLTAAKMSGQLIQKRSTDEKILHMSQRVVHNMDRADKMIQDLLDASRIRAGKVILPKLEHKNIVDVVKVTLTNLSTIHGDRFILHAPPQIFAFISPEGLTRIIENLCSNAIKYGSPDDDVEVFLDSSENAVSLSVTNKILGQFNVDVKKLFEPFERGSAAEVAGQKGWGIGLTIVKGIIESMGGTINVETNAEETCFRLNFPINTEAYLSEAHDHH